MEQFLLIFYIAMCAGPIVLVLFARWYVKFLRWRCKLVYSEKAGLWALPFWAVISGFILYLRIKKRGNDVLYQNYINLREWIFYQFQDRVYIQISMARDLAFEEICRRYFAKKPIRICWIYRLPKTRQSFFIPTTGMVEIIAKTGYNRPCHQFSRSSVPRLKRT